MVALYRKGMFVANFTRFHYEEVAKALREACPEPYSKEFLPVPATADRFEVAVISRRAAWEATVEIMATRFSRLNDKFNEDRFFKACGYDTKALRY